ncbi:MAG: GNAT family N-acetyltransferase [Alphaproteobacteria bacterium]
MTIKFFFLSILSIASFSFSALLDDGISVHTAQKNGQFHGKDKRVYLECTYEINIPEEGILKRSFQIKAFEDLNLEGMDPITKGTKLGYLNVSLHGTCLDINTIEIDKRFRNKKLGQEALSTLLSIYSSPKRAHLPFDHFCITTKTYNTAALECYKKCGFEIRPSDKDHPTPPEWVYLFKDKVLKN